MLQQSFTFLFYGYRHLKKLTLVKSSGNTDFPLYLTDFPETSILFF